LLTIAGVSLWRRRLQALGRDLVGLVLLFAAPYLISSLGRGITPPAGGVSVGLLAHLAAHPILVSASALLVPTAALLRVTGRRAAARTRIGAGVAIAFAAAIVGVVVWSPRGGWPDWYTFLWTPALLLVTLPAPRWAVISGIALVAGSSSALVTWGAELAGKIQVAQRDIARLGGEPDPLAVPLLERFGEQVRAAAPPTTASEMYALWQSSGIGGQGYPAHLALWGARGSQLDELTLDSLDLPPSLLSTIVRNLAPADTQRVVQLSRVPGVHYVLLVRLTPDEVMTAAVGPRSELILPGRVGRLLDPSRLESPLYRLTLSPPADRTSSCPPPLAAEGGWCATNPAHPPRRRAGGARVGRSPGPGAALRSRRARGAARRRCSPACGSFRRCRRAASAPEVAQPAARSGSARRHWQGSSSCRPWASPRGASPG
jgi:hypothetical protein